MLFVEVPPYRDRAISHLAKVNFYVINGKKKRSQPQHFIYTPVTGQPSQLCHYRRRKGTSDVWETGRWLKGQQFPPEGSAGKIRAGEVRKYRCHLNQWKPHAEILHPTHLTCIWTFDFTLTPVHENKNRPEPNIKQIMVLLMCAKSPVSWLIKLRGYRK